MMPARPVPLAAEPKPEPTLAGVRCPRRAAPSLALAAAVGRGAAGGPGSLSCGRARKHRAPPSPPAAARRARRWSREWRPRSTSAPPAAPTPAAVVLRVVSTPAGARVLHGDTGETLGVTPLAARRHGAARPALRAPRLSARAGHRATRGRRHVEVTLSPNRAAPAGGSPRQTGAAALDSSPDGTSIRSASSWLLVALPLSLAASAAPPKPGAPRARRTPRRPPASCSTTRSASTTSATSMTR